jgi:hypothetical protein
MLTNFEIAAFAQYLRQLNVRNSWFAFDCRRWNAQTVT